jgi:hypothetical protein
VRELRVRDTPARTNIPGHAAPGGSKLIRIIGSPTKESGNRLVGGATCGGGLYEWHLVFGNALEHFKFSHVSGLQQREVLFVSPLSQPGFESVRTIRNAVDSDGIE